MRQRAIIVGALLLLVVGASGDDLFKREKREDPTIRSVQGAVTDAQDRLVEGAVVKLKNTRSLQVRSFITQHDGTYYFHGLSTNIDYELKADYEGASSATKTLSVFNTRKKAVINLKLESK